MRTYLITTGELKALLPFVRLLRADLDRRSRYENAPRALCGKKQTLDGYVSEHH